MNSSPVDSQAVETSSRIVFLIIDGLGGLPFPGRSGSELEAARIPNLDDLARRSSCGLLDPVAPGITPGSGPGHLALFGYDPTAIQVGRGVLAALGIGFDLTDRDLAARLNFCTLDGKGKVTDRRAGRISSEENERLCGKIQGALRPPPGVEFFIRTVKEHRALLVVRADGLTPGVTDTDPQKTGVSALPPRPRTEGDRRSVDLVVDALGQIHGAIRDETRSNGVLARGFDCYRKIPSMRERFCLQATAIAKYPMYRGLARLVGMELAPPYDTLEDGLATVRARIGEDTFLFFHYKDTDKAGEDGDFDAKVAALERIDGVLHEFLALHPDVLVITGDHSTPALLAAHSWHPVPALLHASTCRPGGVERFTEAECARGTLGRLAMMHLMPLALGHAGKLAKFGA